MEVKKGPNAIKRSIMKEAFVKKTKVEANPKRCGLRDRNSCSVTGVIPDPMKMTQNFTRLNNFTNDLHNMTTKSF